AGGHPGIHDPRLGWLSGRAGLRRAADEPGRAADRPRYHPPPAGDVRADRAPAVPAMKNAVGQILWLVGLTAASVLALMAVDRLTREPAVHAQQRAADFALEELLPGFAEGSPLALDSVAIPQQYWLGLGLTAPAQVQRVRRGSDILAVLVPTISTQGYGGPIQLLVGIDRHGMITGVRV